MSFNLFTHCTQLASIFVPLFRGIPRGIKRGYKHLEPLFKDRLEKEARYGKDWPEKPVRNSYISASAGSYVDMD